MRESPQAATGRAVIQRVSKMTRGVFGLVAMTLVACAGGPEADDAPSYADDSNESGAGATNQQTAPGGETQTARGAQTSDNASESTECRLQRPYRITAVGVGCDGSADYDVRAITGFDAEACTATVFIDGTNFIRVQCEPGDPVTECTGTTSNDAGCTYEWTLYPSE